MKFKKLKGRFNYSIWVSDARLVLILSNVQSVVKENAVFTGELVKDKDGKDIPLAPVTPAIKKEMLKAQALINITVDLSIRDVYNGIYNPHLIQKKLEEQYIVNNDTSRDQVFRGLAIFDLTKFTNLYDYANQLKYYKQRIIKLGAVILP